MTTAECIDSLHRAMCSTFNADYHKEASVGETLIKQDMDESKKCIRRGNQGKDMLVKKDYTTLTARCAKEQKTNKPLKSDEHPPAHNEPSMELLLSSMSNTFDAECATCTDEAEQRLNHDLAEDKTIKWRNLVNNKFAYKENITHKRIKRVKKHDKIIKTNMSCNRKTAQARKVGRPKKNANKLNEKRRHARRSANTLTESDDEDSQQLNETKESELMTAVAFESQLTVCKEEIIVDDDDISLLAAKRRCLQTVDGGTQQLATEIVPIKLETIKQDVEDIDNHLETVEVKDEQNELSWHMF